MLVKSKLIPGFFALALVVACHNKTASVITSRTDFPPPPKSSAKATIENSPEAIAAGKVLFETRCNRCHDLKIVDVYSPERWATILPTMIPRARLNEDQAKQLRSYVMANAKK
jgi:mono/diheme cytochrome c family protein